MKTIISKGRHILGKLSRNCDKTAPRNCEAALTWELRQDGERVTFSACGEVWNHIKSDTIWGGQCVADLAALFPRDALAQRIRETWAAYHLNDMHAGTPEQTAALKSGREELAQRMQSEPEAAALFYHDKTPNWHAIARHLGKTGAYDVDADILRAAGVYDVAVTPEIRAAALGGLPDDATLYRYGSRWLYSPIPADVVALIRRGFLAENETPEDFTPETAETMREDCARFIRENAADLAAYAEERAGLEWSAASLAGHDFWLTRNHHGAGFWDRGLSEELGERLTAAAQAFGTVDLYTGDDGKIYA